MPKTTKTKPGNDTLPKILPDPLRDGGPYQPKVEIAIIRFYGRVRTLGLPIPEPVAAAVRALAVAAAWVTEPNEQLPLRRREWETAMLDAARAGQPQPPADLVVEAALSDTALKAVRESVKQTVAALRAEAIRQIRADLDLMLASLAERHDQIAEQIRTVGAQIPATVIDGDTALVADVGGQWLQLTGLAEQWFTVRDCRERAASIDHPPGADTYVSFRQPQAIPRSHRWPEPRPLRAWAQVTDTLDAQPWCPSRDDIRGRLKQDEKPADFTGRRRRRPPQERWLGEGIDVDQTA